MILSIAANQLTVGMIVNHFRVREVAKVSNGDIYYRTLLGVKRVNANRIIKINIGDKQ